MKVERINEVQIKFILTKTDLEKRALDITDLAYGSSKTQELFQDIVETASREFFFNVEDTPLMIEAVPMSKNSITIMLTKVSGDSNKLPPLAENLLKKIEALPKQNANTNQKSSFETKMQVESSSRTKKVDTLLATNKYYVYSFDNLDDISEVARIIGKTNMISSVYKHKEEYMLILDSNNETNEKIHMIIRILNERAQKVQGRSELVRAYLLENAEKIISKKAFQILLDL